MERKNVKKVQKTCFLSLDIYGEAKNAKKCPVFLGPPHKTPHF